VSLLAQWRSGDREAACRLLQRHYHVTRALLHSRGAQGDGLDAACERLWHAARQVVDDPSLDDGALRELARCLPLDLNLNTQPASPALDALHVAKIAIICFRGTLQREGFAWYWYEFALETVTLEQQREHGPPWSGPDLLFVRVYDLPVGPDIRAAAAVLLTVGGESVVWHEGASGLLPGLLPECVDLLVVIEQFTWETAPWDRRRPDLSEELQKIAALDAARSPTSSAS
jgi:hypothetical protein